MKAFCSRTSFVNPSTAPLQKMRARVTRDGTKYAKNSTFIGYDIYLGEVNPTPGKRCPVTVYCSDS